MLPFQATPIPLPEGGFAPVQAIEREAFDRRTTRRFFGAGTNFIAIPGCRRVDAVRVGPLPLPEKILHEVPIDATLQRLIPLEYNTYRLIHAVDGTPLLQRSRYSNFGEWAKGVEVYVAGEWDETISPIPEPEPPPDTVSHPVAVADGERRGPGRPRKE